jgi:hypothetical protein
MDGWERWSLRNATIWGIALAGVALLLDLVMRSRWPALADLFWCGTNGALFASVAALRNWLFRASIAANSKPKP